MTANHYRDKASTKARAKRRKAQSANTPVMRESRIRVTESDLKFAMAGPAKARKATSLSATQLDSTGSRSHWSQSMTYFDPIEPDSKWSQTRSNLSR